MGDLLVRKLDEDLMQRLKRRADERNMSLSDTATEILATALRPSREELFEEFRRIRAMSPPSTIDSTDLIREDRDSR